MKVIAILMVVLGVHHVDAQFQWYFGENAGIDFSSGAPVNDNNGQVQYAEGISSASDCQNKLLFYSDGKTVWNKNHGIMPNGQGLIGHFSATQGCLIVPMPDNPDLYFVFTCDGRENSYSDGLSYSMVDISLDNGLGDVTIKNQMLHPSCSEKVCATMHDNKKDIWLIWHGNATDTMYSMLITSTGLSGTINAQAIGPALTNLGGIGQMKASQQGDKIAFASLNPEIVGLMNFDNTIGTFSNDIIIPSSHFTRSGLYGLEFSPNGNFLYVSNHHIDYLNQQGYLYQFNLTIWSAPNIQGSGFMLGTNTLVSDMRGMQLGPDNKIYISQSLSNYLGVINDPDLPNAAANYDPQGYFLGTQVTLWSLPNFVSGEREIDTTNNLQAHFTIDHIGCSDDEIILSDSSDGNVLSYRWYIDGTLVGQGSDLKYQLESPGTHNIRYEISNQCHADTAYRSIILDDCNCASSVFIPSGFSPNGDGNNDVFYIRSDAFELEQFNIYDRLGKRIYVSSNLNQGWDGTINGKRAEASTYTYTVTGTCIKSGASIERHGNITLFR